MSPMDELSFAVSALTVFSGGMDSGAAGALRRMLNAGVGGTAAEAARAYGEMYLALAQSGKTIADLVYDAIIDSDTPLTRALARDEEPTGAMKAAIACDLCTLGRIAGLTTEKIRAHLCGTFPDYADAIARLPVASCAEAQRKLPDNWADAMALFRRDIRENGYGVFARSHVFSLDEQARLVPIRNYDPVEIADLIGYQRQIEAVRKNTQALVDGRGASDVLLYGDKGTGKSSTVKAMVNHFAKSGLRMVVIKKAQIPMIPQVMTALADCPLKFILFLDDLSFSDVDDDYSALKAIIEGGEEITLTNVAIYVTSNRRHLVRETFSARQGDEVHLSDTMDEAGSLSDRFALQLTYLKLNRADYVETVTQIAQRAGVTTDEDFITRALAFSVRKGGYSPRVANQFVQLCISGQD